MSAFQTSTRLLAVGLGATLLGALALVLLSPTRGNAGIIESNGSLGALNIPAGATVSVSTFAKTLSFDGTTYTGRSVSVTGGTVTVFDFTNITIGSGVTIDTDPAGPPPMSPH